MLTRLYVNNFRCFQNFEFKIDSDKSILLVGKNGAGKSTVAKVLSIFRDVGQGMNRIGSLVKRRDFAFGQTSVPMHFELEAQLEEKSFHYILRLDFPENFKEPRIIEEKLSVNGEEIFARSLFQVSVSGKASPFTIDWHLFALSVIITSGDDHPILAWKEWLAGILVLSPTPQQIKKDAAEEVPWLEESAENMVAYLRKIIADDPEVYTFIIKQILRSMPDIKKFRMVPQPNDSRLLTVDFQRGEEELSFEFDQLSDGERILILAAVVQARARSQKSSLVFWDEPDSYLSLSEVQQMVYALRKLGTGDGQILITSHHPETIKCFSLDNTVVISRRSHLEPSGIRPATKIVSGGNGDLVEAFVLNELE